MLHLTYPELLENLDPDFIPVLTSKEEKVRKFIVLKMDIFLELKLEQVDMEK